MMFSTRAERQAISQGCRPPARFPAPQGPPDVMQGIRTLPSRTPPSYAVHSRKGIRTPAVYARCQKFEVAPAKMPRALLPLVGLSLGLCLTSAAAMAELDGRPQSGDRTSAQRFLYTAETSLESFPAAVLTGVGATIGLSSLRDKNKELASELNLMHRELAAQQKVQELKIDAVLVKLQNLEKTADVAHQTAERLAAKVAALEKKTTWLP